MTQRPNGNSELMTQREPMHAMAPRTFGEAMEFSRIISNSSLVPGAYRGKPADILVAIQLGHSVGLAPIQSLQYIAVINGRPSLFGDAALALCRRSPLCVDIRETFDEESQTATCEAHRRGSRPVVHQFSMSEAKQAGLLGKQGVWSQYPKRMLQMRARGFALRDAFPDVLLGMSVAEEAMDTPADDTFSPGTPGTGSWRAPKRTEAQAIEADFEALASSEPEPTE